MEGVEFTPRVALKSVSGSVDNPVHSAGGSAPWCRLWRVFKLGHEPSVPFCHGGERQPRLHGLPPFLELHNLTQSCHAHNALHHVSPQRRTPPKGKCPSVWRLTVSVRLQI